jgi:hypothetical protein
MRIGEGVVKVQEDEHNISPASKLEFKEDRTVLSMHSRSM